jgi:hypothetical protein
VAKFNKQDTAMSGLSGSINNGENNQNSTMLNNLLAKAHDSKSGELLPSDTLVKIMEDTMQEKMLEETKKNMNIVSNKRKSRRKTNILTS